MKISELPEEVRKVALLRKKKEEAINGKRTTDELDCAFNWFKTTEGFQYWEEWYYKTAYIKTSGSEPKHYDNSKGSLYKFCEQQDLNTYEFDIIKRVMRCRKKGMFIEDLEKTKFLIDLYIAEMKQ
jgi:hypothetical protein